MYKSATQRILFATVLSALGLSGIVTGQSTTGQPRADWRHVGNSAIDRSLAGLATGPVDRVWFSATGSLLAHTPSGQVFETADFESWHASNAVAPEARAANAAQLPESAALVRGSAQNSTVVYAARKFAWRSDTAGAGWDNLTFFRGSSILGGELHDLAVSPQNEDEIVVAGADGVFRSMDGGKSWSGLNQGLPNLPAARLLRVPSGDHGVTLALADGSAVEWQPGQRVAWTPAGNQEIIAEAQDRATYSQRTGARQVSAIAKSGDYVYLGMADGSIEASADGGATWKTYPINEAGAVERFWVSTDDPRVALAAIGAKAHDASSPVAPVHLVKTQNGGQFWDALTGNLPDVGTHGVAADLATGAVYVATDAGIYMTYTDLRALGAAPEWTALSGLPKNRAMDVKLDASGNQLWAAMEGSGVYATLAPHRTRDPRVVSTADLVARAASPGALVSVLGARVENARAGDLQVPVLTANDHESQLQIPFEANCSAVSLAVEGSNGPVTLPPVTLAAASPAVVTDRDGSPVVLDAESGVMLDAMNPVHSHGRIQILMTGLGRVKPDWPTGLAAPAENPPQVVATVHAYLDRQPVVVTRAVLAPYIGFYLVEIEVPKIVNYGPEELYLEAGGAESNRVRVYIQP